MHDLDGLNMYVSATDAIGVVDRDTCLRFRQRGVRVWARYAGGRVARGWLVGRWDGDALRFRYAQVEDGRIHAGSSVCDAVRLPRGRLRLVEHFAWRTRQGSGVNHFDQA
jgi:hypothetical protein